MDNILPHFDLYPQRKRRNGKMDGNRGFNKRRKRMEGGCVAFNQFE
jgi:hypothetical protein